MGNSTLHYPRGKIAVEGGELQDCFNVDGSFEDGRVTVHTFRGGGDASGVTDGKRSCTIAFQSAISEEGFERDYLGKWQRGEKIQVRFKFPGGKVCTVDGKWTKPSWKSNVDGFVEFSISIIGKGSIS